MGSALLEVVIATGLLATILTAIAPVTTAAMLRVHLARRDALAGHLARQRLDHLMALPMLRDPSGVVMDVHAGFAGDGFAQGGSGLAPTGAAPLAGDVAGGVDWLDARGRFVARDPGPPPTAHYRRRWGVLTGPGPDCVQLWVVVSPLDGQPERHVDAGATRCAWGVASP